MGWAMQCPTAALGHGALCYHRAMDPVELSIFSSRMTAICDEMGAVLQRTSFSPNIRDRLDFSCAVFDADGELCAQAAHIPVHLGSMAYAMRDLVAQVTWRHGDMVIANDPFLGGTHLPDVTVIAPVFVHEQLCGFVANRAHHADIGAATPGSMPISHTLDQEGMVIAPSYLLRNGAMDDALLRELTERTGNPRGARGDFAAQVSANRTGIRRLEQLIDRFGVTSYLAALQALNDYAERLARSALAAIPDGEYRFTDYMDDDGQGNQDLAISARIEIRQGEVLVDFEGTAPQVPGNINCPLSVAAAAVYYVFRCLMPSQTPPAAGSFRAIHLRAPAGCLLNARRPAAVAAGNVETSTRIVDVVCGALAQAMPERIPAASHGSMNNLALGARGGEQDWDYYETIGGGMGSGRDGGGISAVQTHMTNTLNTPIEVLEMYYPVRITRYGLRRGSGGAGARRGGDGIVRELQFLAPAQATVLSERRRRAPWGAAGGSDGMPGANWLNDQALPGKFAIHVRAGDRLRIETAGGGGWGGPPTQTEAATTLEANGVEI